MLTPVGCRCVVHMHYGALRWFCCWRVDSDGWSPAAALLCSVLRQLCILVQKQPEIVTKCVIKFRIRVTFIDRLRNVGYCCSYIAGEPSIVVAVVRCSVPRCTISSALPLQRLQLQSDT